MTEPRCVECQVPTDGTLRCPVCDHGPLCGSCYDEHDQHACLMGEYD
jgi:hypothetical protein